MDPRKIDEFSDIDSIGRPIVTVSAIAFNLDLVTSDSTKSRADEIKVLIVKKRKQKNQAQPPGYGSPTGQVDENESLEKALERETKNESGYRISRVLGKLFVVEKPHVNNKVHLFLVDVYDLPGRVIETDEIDNSVEPWLSLRQVFEMPLAQDRHGQNRNPDGIFFSHRQRIYRTIDSILFYPESLIDSKKISSWSLHNRNCLMDAMADLEKAGLLEDFLPDEPDDEHTHEQVGA